MQVPASSPVGIPGNVCTVIFKQLSTVSPGWSSQFKFNSVVTPFEGQIFFGIFWKFILIFIFSAVRSSVSLQMTFDCPYLLENMTSYCPTWSKFKLANNVTKKEHLPHVFLRKYWGPGKKCHFVTSKYPCLRVTGTKTYYSSLLLTKCIQNSPKQVLRWNRITRITYVRLKLRCCLSAYLRLYCLMNWPDSFSTYFFFRYIFKFWIVDRLKQAVWTHHLHLQDIRHLSVFCDDFNDKQRSQL